MPYFPASMALKSKLFSVVSFDWLSILWLMLIISFCSLPTRYWYFHEFLRASLSFINFIRRTSDVEISFRVLIAHLNVTKLAGRLYNSKIVSKSGWNSTLITFNLQPYRRRHLCGGKCSLRLCDIMPVSSGF